MYRKVESFEAEGESEINEGSAELLQNSTALANDEVAATANSTDQDVVSNVNSTRPTVQNITAESSIKSSDLADQSDMSDDGENVSAEPDASSQTPQGKSDEVSEETTTEGGNSKILQKHLEFTKFLFGNDILAQKDDQPTATTPPTDEQVVTEAPPSVRMAGDGGSCHPRDLACHKVKINHSTLAFAPFEDLILLLLPKKRCTELKV